MLSFTFLRQTGHDDIVVPMVSTLETVDFSFISFISLMCFQIYYYNLKGSRRDTGLHSDGVVTRI